MSKSQIMADERGHQLQMSLLQSQQDGSEHDLSPNRIVSQKSQIHVHTSDQQSVPNLIRNQKYSMITFIPQVLYEQFKYFFNLFYLLTALSQFIPALKVGLMFSFVAPLVLVLALTMMKEAYEDYQRFLKDKQVNSAEFTVINGQNRYYKKSSQLHVGDIIEVATGQSIPADCLLLSTISGKGSIFIKTDQLDGETDWKLRKSLLPSEQIPQDYQIMYEDPQINIYKFIGSMKLKNDEVFGLGLENTAWRGVKMASGKALLMVLYTGKNTKLSLNMKKTQNKFGLLDNELNFFSKILFVVMVVLSTLLLTLKGFSGTAGQNFILFFKYFLLLCSIIPISMRVNLDFAKLVYKYQIDRDKNMTDSLCRNSNIPQQLGRIGYILSDKTGTLTQNQMIFRKLFLGLDCKYQSDDTKSLKSLLSKSSNSKSDHKIGERKSKNQKYSQLTVDTIKALIICHNVTPVVEDDGTQALQGSSPDQLTLVKFTQSLGFKLLERSEDEMKILFPNGQTVEYRILNLFPFTSESKRMGIIVQQQQSQQIMLYVKGADSIMQPKISTTDSDFMTQACSDLARQGLRTLVITQKHLKEEAYVEWKKKYDSANAQLRDREQKINQCRQILEKGMEFLAVTGVQDKLQQNVVQTVASARSIGIKVWMLTGDKVETAICVGRAVKLIQSRQEKLFVIEGITTSQQFKCKMEQFYEFIGFSGINEVINQSSINCVIVIDGNSLKFALQDFQKDFFNIAVRLPAIICSRVSPTQKAEVASLVIKYSSEDSGRVLGIGDGGNDVALIQSAHVGVGIYGKQGVQAALASDFSIGKFKDLNQLIYWHGRLAYKRSSLLAQFIIHRGVIITLMQTIFIIEFYFVPLPIYNGALMLGYSTIFTMLPVFSLILDEDISRSIAQKYPILYKSTQSGDQVSLYSFLYWMLISFYQGALIMILISVLLLNQSFYMVTTVSFTCLILIEFLNVFTELHKIHIAQIISTLISFAIYVASIFLMRNVLNGVELFTSSCFPITLMIVGATWGPPFLYEKVKRCLYPTEQQKIMKQAQAQQSRWSGYRQIV